MSRQCGATSVVVQIPLRTWLDEMWMRESAPQDFGEGCLLAVVDVVFEGAGDVVAGGDDGVEGPAGGGR